MNNASEQIEEDEDVRDYRAVLAHSAERVRSQFKRSIVAILALFICVFLTYLFLDVGPFHSYWLPYGEIALLLTFAALIAALYCVLLAYGAWSQKHSTEKEFNELLEDRFGVR